MFCWKIKKNHKNVLQLCNNLKGSAIINHRVVPFWVFVHVSQECSASWSNSILTVVSILFGFFFSFLVLFLVHRQLSGSRAARQRQRQPHVSAAGLVNGKWQFSIRTESTHLNWSPKIYFCHRWLRRRPLQLYQIWCTSVLGKGLLGEWAKYSQFCIYTPFGELNYRSDPSVDFRAWWLKRRNLAQGCAFWGFVDMAPHLGGQIPQTSNFGGVNRRFHAKLAKSKNMHIIKTTASIPTKFCTVIKTTKCRSWVVQLHT